ncbi:unnamed protein product [Closterium sp. NIES-65]|nr:unnamed protein product [Closterium sp. NIES-65]
MSFRSQTSVAPSWRVSWSLFLLLAVALFVFADVLVIRYSCSGSSPPWRRRSTSESKFVKAPVEATAAEIGPLAGGADRQGMMDEAADLGSEEADAREMDEADTRRGMDEADTRGVDERVADRLRYPGRKRVLGFVGVQTGFKNRRKRALLRETWFPGTPEEHARVEAALGLAFRFIVGHSASAKEEQLMQAENSTHGDFLRIDVDEGYLNLNHKTLVYFTSLFKLYEADFYIKADDDIYLIPERLSSLIARPRDSPRTYLGCFKRGTVITDPKKRWFEPNSELLGSHYFAHAFGSIYSLSYGVVEILNAIPEDGLSMHVEEAPQSCSVFTKAISGLITLLIAGWACSQTKMCRWGRGCSPLT